METSISRRAVWSLVSMIAVGAAACAIVALAVSFGLLQVGGGRIGRDGLGNLEVIRLRTNGIKLIVLRGYYPGHIGSPGMLSIARAGDVCDFRLDVIYGSKSRKSGFFYRAIEEDEKCKKYSYSGNVLKLVDVSPPI